ncbi:hypothetical protein HOA93_02220 [bacterium]|nr:hypothetical protein [bacterium]
MISENNKIFLLYFSNIATSVIFIFSNLRVAILSSIKTLTLLYRSNFSAELYFFASTLVKKVANLSLITSFSSSLNFGATSSTTISCSASCS